MNCLTQSLVRWVVALKLHRKSDDTICIRHIRDLKSIRSGQGVACLVLRPDCSKFFRNADASREFTLDLLHHHSIEVLRGHVVALFDLFHLLLNHADIKVGREVQFTSALGHVDN